MSTEDLDILLAEVKQSIGKLEHGILKRGQPIENTGSEIYVQTDPAEVENSVDLEVYEPLLGGIAKRIYEGRRAREKIIGSDLFSEPVWDILLDLFYQQCLGRRVSVTSCCIAANVPPTTALRWISVLIDRGILSRRPSNQDKRTTYIELTKNGYLVVANSLTAIESSIGFERKLAANEAT